MSACVEQKRRPLGSIRKTKRRKADIAWLYTDSSDAVAHASQTVINNFKDSVIHHSEKEMLKKGHFKKWKMNTAVGGGPVLLQNGEINTTNKEELKLVAKAMYEKKQPTPKGSKPGIINKKNDRK